MRRNAIKKLLLMGFLSFLFFTCKKEFARMEENQTGPDPVNGSKGTDGFEVKDGFTFSTVYALEADLHVIDSASMPIKNARLTAFAGNRIVFTGNTDENGRLNTKIELPSFLKELGITAEYGPGKKNVLLPVVNEKVSATLMLEGIGGQVIVSDRDKDGVADVYDEFPDDPARAFNLYYPSAGSMATLAFEDLWPSAGDMDMNDVVVDYMYHAVSNAQNKVVSLDCKYNLRAAGGVFKNAFCVEMPFPASVISNISGAAGLEKNPLKAVITVFGNSKALLPDYNTLAGKAFRQCDTVRIHMDFSSPQDIHPGVFNPFIYIDEVGKGRGCEVHLAGLAGSSLADPSLFGKEDDATEPLLAKYYQSKSRLPFAINIPEKFDYPLEKVPVME